MDRKSLEAQITTLAAQELQTIHQLGEIRGALGVVRTFLAQLPPDAPPSNEDASTKA